LITRKPQEKLFQIDSGYYCAGIIIKSIVIKTAPVLHWMIGKTEKFIKNYCEKKKFKLKEI